MFILHIALQGCLRGARVPYGITPDTGGHIRYLLGLVAAADGHPDVTRQEIVVRRFRDERLGCEYAGAGERISSKSRIVRLWGRSPDYRSKEEMGAEIDALWGSLQQYLSRLDRLPDVIHAHYADAGNLARMARKRFGIPFIFTGHSLGRVKRIADPSTAADPVLAARIEVEDAVIREADVIVSSSRDEAEGQYGLYPTANAVRIRINPPGCNLARFGTTTTGDAGRRLIEPHLDHSERPPILAISRPVRKKNLQGLLDAYASDARLRDGANLVIFAGNHEREEDLDAEARDVLANLRRTIAEHGLEGRVALPPAHDPRDVPSIYRYAAERGGVFANVALNEPFGLTFLEAAASGVPVVATESGGPVDIVGRCRNGHLVDPCDQEAIAGALAHLLGDHEVWTAAAANGLREARYYDWERHVRQYLPDVANLAARSRAAAVTAERPLVAPTREIRLSPARGFVASARAVRPDRSERT